MIEKIVGVAILVVAFISFGKGVANAVATDKANGAARCEAFAKESGATSHIYGAYSICTIIVNGEAVKVEL